MQDLSSLLPGDPVSALTPTSQEGGNMRASNEEAMTAPGSQPVDVMHPAGDYFGNDPAITATNKGAIPPGTDGKPQASSQRWTGPGTAAWSRTATPGVVRKPAA
jgi:hypothetical protein